MCEIKQLSFDELFDFPTISSGITAKFIHQNVGKIPVYGSKKDGKPVGFIKDDLPNVKYFKNCLSWNRNGSVGYVFYRDHKFTTTDDHRPLEIKDLFRKDLDVSFLRYTVQNEIFNNGFAWGNKAGVEKIKKLFLSIPFSDGKYDLQKQKELAKRYEKINQLQIQMGEYYNILKNCTIVEENDNSVFKEEDLLTFFEPYKGDQKYTSKYIAHHSGEFPVFSGATKDYGEIGKIDKYDWDTQGNEWLTWTTDGVYAGTVFKRNGKFSMNTHCGLLKPKGELKNIDISYIRHILNKVLPNNALGEQNKRVTVGIIKTIRIPIPINAKGDYDLQKQKNIASRLDKIEKVKKQLSDALFRIKTSQIKIDI